MANTGWNLICNLLPRNSETGTGRLVLWIPTITQSHQQPCPSKTHNMATLVPLSGRHVPMPTPLHPLPQPSLLPPGLRPKTLPYVNNHHLGNFHPQQRTCTLDQDQRHIQNIHLQCVHHNKPPQLIHDRKHCDDHPEGSFTI